MTVYVVHFTVSQTDRDRQTARDRQRQTDIQTDKDRQTDVITCSPSDH